MAYFLCVCWRKWNCGECFSELSESCLGCCQLRDHGWHVYYPWRVLHAKAVKINEYINEFLNSRAMDGCADKPSFRNPLMRNRSAISWRTKRWEMFASEVFEFIEYEPRRSTALQSTEVCVCSVCSAFPPWYKKVKYGIDKFIFIPSFQIVVCFSYISHTLEPFVQMTRVF